MVSVLISGIFRIARAATPRSCDNGGDGDDGDCGVTCLGLRFIDEACEDGESDGEASQCEALGCSR